MHNLAITPTMHPSTKPLADAHDRFLFGRHSELSPILFRRANTSLVTRSKGSAAVAVESLYDGKGLATRKYSVDVTVYTVFCTITEYP